jgi:hypothetical protein
MTLRLIAEHEAAHAIVALAYGVPVTRVVATRTRGRTSHGTCTRQQAVAIAAAGDLFNREFGTVPYRDASCSDLAYLEREVEASGVWKARRDARAVLRSRQQDVIDLARLLEQRGSLVRRAGTLRPG